MIAKQTTRYTLPYTTTFEKPLTASLMGLKPSTAGAVLKSADTKRTEPL